MLNMYCRHQSNIHSNRELYQNYSFMLLNLKVIFIIILQLSHVYRFFINRYMFIN
jgi:hypothetical protein